MRLYHEMHPGTMWPMAELSPFASKVIETVRKIPQGQVATYKQIAGLCGKPHASRGVAWILNSCSKKYKLPWHRVLSSQARISFKIGTHAHLLQKSKLKREGVRFDGESIDMGKFQWKKQSRVKRLCNKPKMFN